MEFIRYRVGRENRTQEIDKPEKYEDIQIRGLVESAVEGNIEAFGEIYGVFLDRIYRYIFYQVNDRAAAEDLTEEVFLKAWGGIQRYTWKGQPFSAWLFRIAHNHVIDYYRTSRKFEALEEELPADNGDPEEETEGKQMRQEVLEAIATLPQEQQQVVIMKFIEELDNREIEQITGKSQGAIRVMQMRALATLRRKLNGEMRNEN